MVYPMTINLSRITYIIDSLVKIPSYALLGETHERIVFLSTREGVLSLWSIDLEGKDLKRLTIEPITDALITRTKSPYVIFLRDITKGRELHRLFMVDARGGEERLIAETPLMRIFSASYDGSKIAFTGATSGGIGLYISDLKGNWEKLTDLDIIAFTTDLNDKYIVGFGNLRKDPRTFELFIYDMDTSELKVYTPKEGSNNKAPLLYDERLLFESNFNGKNRLYLYDPETNEISEVKFTHNDYYDYDPVEHDYYGWTNEKILWAIGKKNGRSKLFLDGKEIPTPTGTIHGIPAFHGKHVFLAISNIVTPTKIYKINISDGTTNILIDNKLPDDIAKSLGKVEFVKYRSFDDLDIPMYIVYSNISSKPGPGVVYVHGGPWSEVRDVWSIMIASLVANGYHVLAPNFRGSTGYGDEFRTLDIGDPGGGDLLDTVYARKWGIDNKVVKEDQVAIMGYSYGGYMTYLAIGKYPDLWKCGVAGAGIIDWEEMYGLSDAIFKKFIEVLFAGKHELWKERSPITYVENIKSPLCIIHPQNDTRTPLKPVLRYMNRLLELGKTFEAHIAPDMGHRIVKMDDAVKILLPALIFLERYLKI